MSDCKKILLVDDNPDIINTIVNILEKESFIFYQARNGIDAYDIACIELPDLVITDWEMPLCNGLKLIEKLKQNIQTKEIAIIMLTGMMTASTHLKKALELGANDFMSKPINEIELRARVNSVLSLFDAHKKSMKFQQKLAEAEKKILHQKLHLAEEVLTRKIAQLASTRVKIDEFVYILKGIHDNCNSVDKSVVDKHIRTLQIERNENVVEDFFNSFEQQHPGYFANLLLKHPDLTYKEQKMCALIRLSLTNKQIADFFSNTENTIKTARKLLRKKLDIKPDVDIVSYLKVI